MAKPIYSIVGPKAFRISDYYTPLPRQRQFHESPAKYKCYMGGVGSGKTTALVWEALMWTLEYPNNYGLLGRFTFPELRDTTMYEFFQICPTELIAEYSKTEHRVTFHNGSTILFRHLEDPDKLKSLNLGWFGIDELTEVPEDVFLMLQSRLRKKDVPFRPGFGSTNPEGHDWVWWKFCQQHRTDRDYLFIQAPTTENKHLPEGYVEDLVRSFPEHWRKRYIEGDPSAFAGQIITAFDERVHVIQPFTPPPGWGPRAVVLDHGTNNPTAVLWFVCHPESPFKIVYKEHYEAGQIIDYHARRIFELNQSDNVDAWLADPAIFNRTLQDPRRGLHSVADEYAEHGIHFAQGDNDVKAGIQKLLDHFQVWDKLINPFTQKQASPKIFITANCENTIREIPQYKYKDLRVRGRSRAKSEEPEKQNDHTVDDIRYYLMSDPKAYVPRKEKYVPFPNRHDKVWATLEKRSRLHKRFHPNVAERHHDYLVGKKSF